MSTMPTMSDRPIIHPSCPKKVPYRVICTRFHTIATHRSKVYRSLLGRGNSLIYCEMSTWIWWDAISDFFLISNMSLKHLTPHSCNRVFLRTCPQDYWTGWTVGRLGKAGFPGVGRCENARSAGAGIGQSPQPIPDRPASNLKAVTFSILPPGQAPGWPHYQVLTSGQASQVGAGEVQRCKAGA